jgi:excinuclease ABC subunit A
LKMKFRTGRNTFQADDLVARLDLKPLNDMPELPLYGREPRVKVQHLRGPWQEVDLKVHSYAEIARPEFWQFVDEAVEGFAAFRKRVEKRSDILHPWKQLGRKWHLARRGFTAGKTPQWDVELLDTLLQMLCDIAPDANILWTNKQVVPLHLPGHQEPWAAVQTKKSDAVYLYLTGPKNQFTQGQIRNLGHSPEIDGERADADVIHLRFRNQDDLGRGELKAFLQDHLRALAE